MTTTPLPHLHRLIIAAFDENDLRTLAFTLAVPYDTLPRQGTAAVARELILHLAGAGASTSCWRPCAGSRSGTESACWRVYDSRTATNAFWVKARS